MYKILKAFLISVLCLSFFVINVDNAKAASLTATISASPASGNHRVDEEFDIEIIADGGGQNITSFKANVLVSNLNVISLTQGPVSLWIANPSTASLSFYGGVTGTVGVANIIVYTLRVKGIEVGNAGIIITNGHVYNFMQDITPGVSGGVYTITAPATPTPTIEATPTSAITATPFSSPIVTTTATVATPTSTEIVNIISSPTPTSTPKTRSSPKVKAVSTLSPSPNVLPVDIASVITPRYASNFINVITDNNQVSVRSKIIRISYWVEFGIILALMFGFFIMNWKKRKKKGGK